MRVICDYWFAFVYDLFAKVFKLKVDKAFVIVFMACTIAASILFLAKYVLNITHALLYDGRSAGMFGLMVVFSIVLGLYFRGKSIQDIITGSEGVINNFGLRMISYMLFLFQCVLIVLWFVPNL